MNPLYEPILAMQAVDIHSHLRGEGTQAHHLGEVFFYHVAAQAMIAAGMPPELAHGDRPVEERIREALPYFERIRNTTMSWMIRETLMRVHAFDGDDPTWEDWAALAQRFRETAEDPSWARVVLCRRGRLSLSVTSMPSGLSAIAPGQRDFLDYTCEQPITSMELLRWLERGKGGPLTTTAELATLVEAHMEERIEAGAGSFTYWPVRGFRCPPEEMPNVDAALEARAAEAELTAGQVALLDDAVAHVSLRVMDEKALPFVMCLGITAGSARRTLLRYDPSEAGEVLAMLLRYPRVRFFLMLGNAAQSQEMNTLVKQLPNAYLACAWWHGMYPSYAVAELRERLEMVPFNRLVAVITDAYCAEWSVARSLLSRRVLAEALWEKVASRDYTEEFALEIAQAMLHDTPAEAFRRR